MLKPYHFPSTYKQQGAALIAMFMAIIASGAVFLLSEKTPNNGRVATENKTTESLSIAKNAIIDYAVAYYFSTSKGDHGFLPCPETNNSTAEGSSVLNCAIGGSRHVNQLGRLPWRSLQIPVLKDAAGECLWYAMSGSFSPSPRALMLNDDTPGMFQVINENAQIAKGTSTENRVVAVIMAPGIPVNGQTRPGSTANIPCKVPRNLASASNYLETFQGISNTSVDDINPDMIDQFIARSNFSENTSFNDRLITITSKEIFDAIKSNKAAYDDKIKILGETLGQCIIDYAQAAASSTTLCANITTCYLDCKNARSLCLASASSGPEIASCQKDHATCRSNCRNNCLTYHLPWPAPVNLNNDYRINTNYTDQIPTNTHLCTGSIKPGDV